MIQKLLNRMPLKKVLWLFYFCAFLAVINCLIFINYVNIFTLIWYIFTIVALTYLALYIDVNQNNYHDPNTPTL